MTKRQNAEIVEADTTDISVDPNTYDYLLEIISESVEADEQQQLLRDFIKTLQTPSLSRRLFSAIFPAIESNRRVR
jgi:hypothetical protein